MASSGKGTASLDGGGATGKGGGVSQLGELLSHIREIEEQLLKCQKENVRLRFEYEQAVVELPRLQVGGASHMTSFNL